MITYPIEHNSRTFTPAGQIATRDDRVCADCGAALHRPENGSIMAHYAIVDDDKAICMGCADRRELAAFHAADHHVGYLNRETRTITTFNGATLARVTWTRTGYHNMARTILYWNAIDDTGARWYGKYCPDWRDLTTMHRAQR